jgi:hypothetical protein
VCRSRHHRTKPGIIESERKQKQARYRADAQYRRGEIERVAIWKKKNAAACQEHRRRARLRRMLAATPGVDVYVVTQRMRPVLGRASNAEVVAAFVVAKIKQQTDQRKDR